ncbi:hypothetical protein QQ045_020618 [Rhodiola kirilowii]
MDNKNGTKIVSVLFLLLVAEVCQGQITPNGCALFFPKYTLSIQNLMEPANPIRVHCKSKNDDLGEHILIPGGSTSFSFRANQWTFFWCDVFWNGKWVTYDAYQHDRDTDRCHSNRCNCKWAISSKGPCFWKKESQKYDLCVSWR